MVTRRTAAHSLRPFHVAGCFQFLLTIKPVHRCPLLPQKSRETQGTEKPPKTTENLLEKGAPVLNLNFEKAAASVPCLHPFSEEAHGLKTA